MPRSIATEAIVNDAEPLDEALSLERVPGTPFAVSVTVYTTLEA